MTENTTISNGLLVDELRHWADDHVLHSNGQLSLLSYDPERYSGQDGVSVAGSPQPADLVDSVASLAQPKYHEILELLQADEKKTGHVSRIGDLLQAGKNVALVTNHIDLVDIAITHAAFYSQLNRLGYTMKTGIIISKMVAFLAIQLGDKMSPAVEILKLLENEQFLSYPRTSSATERGVGSGQHGVTKHNSDMLQRISQRLGEGSFLLAIAPSGTIDKPNSDKPNEIIMSRMSNGTLRILSDSIYTVPVAVWYGGETPVFKTCDPPRIITDEEMATGVMCKIAQTLTDRVEGKTFVYQTK